MHAAGGSRVQGGRVQRSAPRGPGQEKSMGRSGRGLGSGALHWSGKRMGGAACSSQRRAGTHGAGRERRPPSILPRTRKKNILRMLRPAIPPQPPQLPQPPPQAHHQTSVPAAAPARSRVRGSHHAHARCEKGRGRPACRRALILRCERWPALSHSGKSCRQEASNRVATAAWVSTPSTSASAPCRCARACIARGAGPGDT